MKHIRMEKPQKVPGQIAFQPEASIADEFQPIFDKRAEQLRAPRPETKHERQTRLAAIFTADCEPLFQETATPEPTGDAAFTNDDLQKLIKE